MIVFVIVFVSMLAVIALMAVGVMAGRKPISGSCGGLGAVGIDSKCEICGGNPAKCEAETSESKETTDFYNADK